MNFLIGRDEGSAALFPQAQDWLSQGHALAIATVISTWGSAPRRAGAHLIIREDGLFAGSVSGGCVEGDVIVTAQALIAEQQAAVFEYGVNETRAWQAGLTCGGTIKILIQPVAPKFFAPALIENIISAQKQGRTFYIATSLDNFQSQSVENESALPSDALQFLRIYTPPLRLAIVGAVHIAQHLARMAQEIGIDVRIIDPRTAFASEMRFEPHQLDTRWPDEALADFKIDEASAIVVLTHDPKIDDLALTLALNSPAFYIAALGSRQNQARRLERLGNMGFSQEALRRIHGPAGLAIGATHPAEIAVAILAELVQCWRQT